MLHTLTDGMSVSSLLYQLVIPSLSHKMSVKNIQAKVENDARLPPFDWYYCHH